MPATTYPDRPAAAPVRVRPGPASGPAPAAGPQVAPSGEVITTGCWPAGAAAEPRVPAVPTGVTATARPPSPPTASHPAAPCTTAVSPGPVPCQDDGTLIAVGAHRP